MTANNDNNESTGEFILYQTEDGRTRIECRFEDETLWLTQAQMAELFQSTPQNITLHLKAIYAEEEQSEQATCKSYLQVRREGGRTIQRQPNMGLTSWKGTKVRKTDVTVAKNYLREGEIQELNRIVGMYLDYAEDQARRRQALYMRDWREKLDAFLQFNERDILTNAGKVAKEVADKLALEQYEIFHARRLAVEAQADEQAFEDAVKKLLAKPPRKKLGAPKKPGKKK